MGEAAASPLPPPDERGVGGRIANAAVILMLGTALSRVLGLVREQLAASRFGTGDEIAAFTVAENVGTLIYDLLVSGALQAALIPVFAGLAAHAAGRDELRRVAGTLVMVAVVGLGTLVGLGVVFAPVVVRGMTALGGDSQARGAETTELTVTLVRLMLPGVVLLGVGTILMAVLHAVGRVGAPSLALAVRNAAIVAAILAFSGTLGVRSLAVGSLLGAAAIVAVQIPSLLRAGLVPKPSFDLDLPAVREVFRLYLPVLLGLMIGAVGVVIDRNLAWGAGEDTLGAMRYATTLVQLVLGLAAAAISLAALPRLSLDYAVGDDGAFRQTLARALAMTTLLIAPAAFGLAAVAFPTVDLLFGHGATDEAGARLIAIALLGYLPGTLAAAYDQVLIFAFYARRDTRTPVLVGVMSVGVYLAVALALVDDLGMMGLVLANSAQWGSHALVLWWLWRRRYGLLGDAALGRSGRLVYAASAVSAAVALLTWLGLDAVVPHELRSVVREGLLVAIPVALAVGVYAVLVAVLRVEEFFVIGRAVRTRMGQRGS